MLRTGCQWRALPHDLVPWWVAYRHFRTWAATNAFDDLLSDLVAAERVRTGRDPAPSAAVIDAQSVKTGEGGSARGYDAGKRVAGRKRHIAVDTNGLLLAVIVTTASLQDRPGGKGLLHLLARRYPSVGLVWADAGYANERESSLIAWARQVVGIVLSIVHRPAGVKGFQLLPRRWVVERTCAWMSRSRRLARDYERKPEHSEAMIKVAMIRILAARLAGEYYTPSGPVEEEAARRIDEQVS